MQKDRSLRNYKKTMYLTQGDIGLLILRPIQLSSQRLIKFKLLLKKAVRKFDLTNRFLWFNSFPHLPLTKKAVNARMGKGKGKLKTWYTNVIGGVVLFEFFNVRYGRARYFIKQIIIRLGIFAVPITKTTHRLTLPIIKNKQILIKANWQ